jgi:signal transduction histidine kinase
MRIRFRISLKNRLTLTYALFISLSLLVLTLIVNQITRQIFTALIKENISEKSGEIVRVMGEQYNPYSRDFDTLTVEAMGMYFVHEGYIVTVEDDAGNPVWDARACDMQQCAEVINIIAERMERDFSIKGAFQNRQYPIDYSGRSIGSVTIETYGPFFYSETETRFLSSMNRLFLVAGFIFILLSIIVSILLATSLARPILKAGEAARQIARVHARGNRENLKIRLPENYKTRELEDLSRSINELAGELEEGERRQKQLTLDIAHELRTPLTCLQGNIEAMLDGVWKPDREHLASCHEEVLRLAALVQDLNTLTNLEWENIKLSRTDFDLAKLLFITAEQFKTTAREKGIAISLNLPLSPINADYDRLKQVFINLLSNAVKYTDSGTIDISLEKTESSSPGRQNYRVSVADSGIGIAAEDLPHVFERFYRSDKSRNRGTGGAGIGLAIAAAIVAAHGGSISVESNNLRCDAAGGGVSSGPSQGIAGTVFRVEL